MRRKSTKIVITIAVAAAVAAGGAAFTADNPLPNDSFAGFGSTSITGAQATSLNYTLSADGKTIDVATLVFNTDLTGRTVKAGFNDGSLDTLCVKTVNAGTTTAVCTFASPQDTTLATEFDVAVSA